jgi:prolyl-tRNA editing enzyme YbaK/EbsC (Cys-tRNA(Pro) deacylase)
MNMDKMGPADLQAYVDQHGISGEILYLDDRTPTVDIAARAVGTRPEQIAKSILFLIDEQPVLAITCGIAYVERRAIAALYGVGRKRVKLASPDIVLEIAGYEVGAMPPFAHRQPLPTLIDRRVLEQPEVYAGGGAENALVRLFPQDILRVTQARVTDLLTVPSSQEG